MITLLIFFIVLGIGATAPWLGTDSRHLSDRDRTRTYPASPEATPERELASHRII